MKKLLIALFGAAVVLVHVVETIQPSYPEPEETPAETATGEFDAVAAESSYQKMCRLSWR
ncbi:hypothetical protein KHA80_13435 [Anaerobacillus sp. HL2]|nr:hypothetical protein KHA80_13435 [Anaerobacillus sp. HL2]